MSEEPAFTGWIESDQHHQWLSDQSDRLFRFYGSGSADLNGGGFWWVDGHGEPVPAQGKQLWINARMIYSFAIGSLLGRPGYAPLAQQGLDYLVTGPLRDTENGGWFWSVNSDGSVSDDSKQAYGHAFVALAAAAGKVAGLNTRDLLADVLDVLETKFWDEDAQMFADTWDASFEQLQSYRGQNANMHLVETLMLVADVTGDAKHLDRAVAISGRLIRDVAQTYDWRLPEHFDSEWVPDLEYGRGNSANLFRPFGSTVGHWLEWSRLLLQLHEATGGGEPWMVSAAKSLFDRATTDGWRDEDRSGFVFSTDFNGQPVDEDRYHWVVAEAIGAAVALYRTTGDRIYERWYQRFWEWADAHLVDADGSWQHQLDSNNARASDAWDGKPDLYHALQATLYARLPLRSSLILEIARGMK